MRSRNSSRAVLLLALALSAGTTLQAQQSSQSEPPPETPKVPEAAGRGIDARKLPGNLEHLQRRIRDSVEVLPPEGYGLRYTVEVFGQAPKLQLFTPQDNLRFAPSRYGAPTHQEMWDLWTPREFNSPVMDFSNLVRWLRERSRSNDDNR